MNAKETVEKGLQARRDVQAAEAEIEKLRQELEEAGHALLSERIAHETEKNNWKSEKRELLDLLRRQGNEVYALADQRDEATRRELDRKQRAALVGAAQTVVLFTLLALCREFGLMNYWLANGLLTAAAIYLFYTVIVMLRKKK